MAIEFHCPSCAAAIRVPDAYSGKQGSCPKCKTKLVVPDVVPHSLNHGAEAAQRTTSSIRASGSKEIPQPNLERPKEAQDESPKVAAEPVVPGIATSMPTSVSRSIRRKNRRRHSSRLYSIGIPVACFVVFLGIIAALTLVRKPELKGTLKGSAANNMTIPRVTVPLSSLGLSADEEAEAMQAFENAPESFISSQMTCRVMLEGAALAVDVSAGEQFRWFAVNPSANVTLSDWIRDHVIEANKARLARISATGNALCKDKILKASGTGVVFDAETYRDGFGLNAHVDAFGFMVEAVTRNRKSPCAHEDANGTLYFALPEDTTAFELRGRTVAGGRAMFPGIYTVQVANSAPDADVSAEPVDASVEPDEPEQPAEQASDGDEAMTSDDNQRGDAGPQ